MRVRFKIAEGEAVTFSPWVEEVVQHTGPTSTAAQVMAQLRREHPNAAISVERDVTLPIKRPVMVRFRIDVADESDNNATFYSKTVPESETDSLREQIENDEILKPFKQKVLTKEIVNG